MLIEEAQVRDACVRAWKMRHAAVNWGVRDWSKLKFHVERDGVMTVVWIEGALEDSALRFLVWEKLGASTRVDVRCRE